MQPASNHLKYLFMAQLIVLLAGFFVAPASAQNAAGTTEISVTELADMLRRQDEQLKKQSAMLARQDELLAVQASAIKSLQTRIDQLGSSGTEMPQLSNDEIEIRKRMARLESPVASQNADTETTTDYDATAFPGALQVPGSDAAIKIGGFVKAAAIQSLDAVGTQNRFIVGTIPTRGDTQGDKEASLTVQQSRLNLELRENTDNGQLRAFIEGDFAGTDDTFRLRHAFGQFQDFLAGKTWTTFMDVESSPEEVDFEGINGRINVRQTQLRYFPNLGEDWNLILSFEDPQPSITGGDGLSQIPDFVASVRGKVRQSWNVKTAILLRNLTARWENDQSIKDRTVGWGLTVSGRRFVEWFGNPRDNVTVQVNYGEGYGRYVNDLATVGGKDAIFDPDGNLEPYPVFASYLSLQKWWTDKLRFNLIASYVDINNFDFEAYDAYNQTWRLSGSMFWSPARRIDLGTEFLWGSREDKDGASGQAAQFQIAARYLF